MRYDVVLSTHEHIVQLIRKEWFLKLTLIIKYFHTCLKIQAEQDGCERGTLLYAHIRLYCYVGFSYLYLYHAVSVQPDDELDQIIWYTKLPQNFVTQNQKPELDPHTY